MPTQARYTLRSSLQEFKKLPLISKFFGVAQTLLGLGSIFYMVYVVYEIGNVYYLMASEKTRLAGQIVYYCGGGLAHALAGGTIISRHSAAPTLIFVVGMWSLLLRVFELYKNPSSFTYTVPLIALTCFYLFWFMSRRKEFE